VSSFFGKCRTSVSVLAVLAAATCALGIVTQNAYPDHEYAWTGRVMSYTNGYQKHNADLMYGKDPPDGKWQGYAKFSLADVPNSAVIIDATLVYFVVSQQQDPPTEVTLLAADPVPAEAQPLWDMIISGQVVSPEMVTDNGWVERPLNAVGLAAVQAGLVDDWVALGVHWTANNNSKGHIKGYMAEPMRPYLRLTYYCPDMGIIAINAPAGEYGSGIAVVPQVAVANNGDFNVPFSVRVQIYDSATNWYDFTVDVAGIEPGAMATVDLPTYFTNGPGGNRTVSATLYPLEDANPADNYAVGWFDILPGTQHQGSNWWDWWGWIEDAAVPAWPTARPIKAGGALAVDRTTGIVYATRGNRSSDFMKFDPTVRKWQQLTPLPEIAPGKGAQLACDGNGHVYLLRGKNTAEFWCYDLQTNEWTRLADVPPVDGRARIGNGSGLVHVKQYGLDYIYLLAGPRGTFARFNVVMGGWTVLTPPGEADIKWDQGSWLATDGKSRIWAHKAKLNQLWYYDLRTDEWGPRLGGIPFYNPSTGASKRAKDGSSAALVDGDIFALKGGNTDEFWRYNIESGEWSLSEPMPQVGTTLRRVKVKTGASLVSYPYSRLLYAVKGNRTVEFWRYFMPPPWLLDGVERPTMKSVAGTTVAPASQVRVELYPEPVRGGLVHLRYSVPVAGRATVTVFDMAGRAVHNSVLELGSSGTADLNLGGLANGVYLLRLAGTSFSATNQLVLTR
jgi:hypothetical protein